MTWVKKHWWNALIICVQVVLNYQWITMAMSSYELAQPGWMFLFVALFLLGCFIIYREVKTIRSN